MAKLLNSILLISSSALASDFFFELPSSPKANIYDFRNQFLLTNINKAIANARRNESSVSKVFTTVSDLKPNTEALNASSVKTSFGIDLKNLTMFNNNKVYEYDINQKYGCLNYQYNVEVKYNYLGTYFTKNIKPDTYNLGIAIHRTFK